MVASEAEGRTEALRRIAECRTTQAAELDLGGLRLTALDGELLAALCQLGWLRRLFLGLSAEVRKERQPAVIILDLDRNRIGAEGAQALKGLVNLTSLDLYGNDIGAEGAQALKGLVNLTSVDLGGQPHRGRRGAG